MVPTTETLLTAKDRETNTLYADLAGSEDFLASHVLRISPVAPGAAAGSVRDNRGKAKQFTTINGRTVIVKESFVYSNKGTGTGVLHLTLADLMRLQASRTSIRRSYSAMCSTILTASMRNNGLCTISPNHWSGPSSQSRLRRLLFQVSMLVSGPRAAQAMNCRAPLRIAGYLLRGRWM